MQRQPRLYKYRVAASAALLSLCFSLPASATTFNFSWSADPLLDPTILSADDPTATALGSLDINVANGASFSNLDITNLSIIIQGVSTPSFVVDTPVTFNGMVSADGSTATLTDLFLGDVLSTNLFLCHTAACSSAIVLINPVGPGNGVGTQYTDAAAALASFKLTAPSVVPLPAALPLLGTGLALFGLMGWRRKRVAA